MWPAWPFGQPCSLANLIRWFVVWCSGLWVFCFLGFLRCDMRRTNEIVRIIQEQHGKINKKQRLTCDLFEQIKRTKHSGDNFWIGHDVQMFLVVCSKFDTHTHTPKTKNTQHAVNNMDLSFWNQASPIWLKSLTCANSTLNSRCVGTLSSRSPLNTTDKHQLSFGLIFCNPFQCLPSQIQCM